MHRQRSDRNERMHVPALRSVMRPFAQVLRDDFGYEPERAHVIGESLDRLAEVRRRAGMSLELDGTRMAINVMARDRRGGTRCFWCARQLRVLAEPAKVTWIDPANMSAEQPTLSFACCMSCHWPGANASPKVAIA